MRKLVYNIVYKKSLNFQMKFGGFSFAFCTLVYILFCIAVYFYL